jgi:hypothetical protein
MKKTRALLDINHSVSSLADPHTSFSGFANRIIRQYGAKAAVWAAEQSKLTPLQVGWMKRVVEDKMKR